MTATDFVKNNEFFCTVAVVVFGIVSITIACLAYNAYVYKVMAQNGYVEVQTVGTVSTHWEKR